MHTVQNSLLEWYRNNRRELPWRTHPTPYRVWLSEIMCQQTRIQTALPYFDRFLSRWPTVEALAQADIEDVLHEWAGLGYYSRARSLHRAAQKVAEMGSFPDTEKGLRQLPGVGPYTAAAIASIAFERDAHLADGNVERVLTRYFGIREDVRSAVGKQAVWGKAKELFPAGKGRDWNQALMEWGALICLPRKPACPVCPVRDGCVARAQDLISLLPYKSKKQTTKKVFGVAVVLEDDRGFLLRKRPEKGLLAGLWEFPTSAFVESLSEDAVLELLGAAFDIRSLDGLVGGRCGSVRHLFTHRDLRLDVYRFRRKTAGVPSLGESWGVRSPGQIQEMGLPRLTEKVWELALSSPVAD